MWKINDSYDAELVAYADRGGFVIAVDNGNDYEHESASVTLSRDQLDALIAELERLRDVDA